MHSRGIKPNTPKKKVLTLNSSNGKEKDSAQSIPQIELLTIVKDLITKDYKTELQKLGKGKEMQALKIILKKDYEKIITIKATGLKTAINAAVKEIAREVYDNAIEKKISAQAFKEESFEQLQKELEYLRKMQEIAGPILGKKFFSKYIKIYEEQIIEQEEQEEQFYKIACKYTNNFSFLAEEPLNYYSRNGGKAKVKFNNLAEYTRFEHLQNLIRARIVEGKCNEQQAIASILDEVSKKERILKPADKRIIKQRHMVLQNERTDMEERI